MRTPKQIEKFRSTILNVVPRSTRAPAGITDIAELAGVLGPDLEWTRVKRRHVNEALASLRASGSIVMIGIGKATKYRRA